MIRPWRLLIVMTAILLTCGVAWSYWSAVSVSGGSGASAAASVDRGAKPTVVVSGSSVAVSWAATGVSNGDAVSGYLITRYDQATLTAQTMLSQCAGAVATTSCSEDSVPDGVWVYSVTPLLATHWRGAESLRSAAATVTTAAPGPSLGSAAAFSILGFTGVTSTGVSTVSGDLGVSPSNAVTGFPPSVVGGDIHAGDVAAALGQADLLLAYAATSLLIPTKPDFAGDLNGLTLHPGIRHTAAAFTLTGTLTLDGDGDPNALFIFQVGAALNTAAASHLVLINGAKASNVFFQVLGAAGTGANSTFAGTILANGAITLGADSELIGRALSRGAVTMAGNTVRFTVALPPAVTIDGGATRLTKSATPTLSGTTTAAPGRTVTVTVAGQTLTTTVQAGGIWSVTAGSLLANTYSVVAKVRDSAGNAGFATQTLTAEISPAIVDLKSAATYSVLATTTVANTGATTIGGNLGLSPGLFVTGFPPGVVSGSTHVADIPAALARVDFSAAYGDAAGRVPSSSFAGDQNGQTFRPGVHHTAAAFALTGTLTIDADGVSSSVFIIQVDAAMNTAAASHVVLANGAKASNVFWQVNGAAGTGANSTLVGTILGNGAITLGAGSTLVGQAMSTGKVTLSGNAISMN
ncbi:MAG: hypothetical protein JWQ70_786 [Aeromicrobium sp.]|nr:hypothetical protein [Aeromicrobium sp.]